ncbi:MAG TPA: glycosyltransferase [Candidatus Hydrogenedentes bacterium]|nr:glycosyltransferase [Candidatus Hydrogenedentota bacterium]
MHASIIIAVYNRREDVHACLSALPVAELTQKNTEVILVDDGSTDGVREMAAQEFPHVQTLRLEDNKGPSFARNLGAKVARGSLLIFLDSDAVPEDRWLDTFLLCDDGNTVLIGRILDYHTGKDQDRPRRSTFLGKSLPCSPRHANAGSSCNLALPASLFSAIGGFDPDIPYYFEDSLLCIHARRHGARFRYLSDARVRHKGSGTRQGDTIRMQEHNSTYAMLMLYRHSFGRVLLFTAGNGFWLLIRLFVRLLTGRLHDAVLLAKGWGSAYSRFVSRTGD